MPLPRSAAASAPFDPALVGLARSLAALARDLNASDRGALEALVLTVLLAVERGDARLSVTNAGLRAACGGLFAADVARDLAGRIGTLLSARRGQPILTYEAAGYAPLVLTDGHAALHRMRLLEGRVVEHLVARLVVRPGLDSPNWRPAPEPGQERPSRLPVDAGSTRPTLSDRPTIDSGRLGEARQTRLGVDVDVDPESIEGAMADLVLRPGRTHRGEMHLTDQQLEAVRRSAQNAMLVVSGGPGTGKTAIIFGMLRLFARLGMPPHAIVLAAPTGKAAHRMTVALNEALASIATPAPADVALQGEAFEARTLHRLLGYHAETQRFRHHENRPLPARVVIVDEASMVDLAMMDQLLRALARDAWLVLLGDPNQLPSVAAGAVFRDLVEADRHTGLFSVHLGTSHRMRADDPDGRHLLEAATAVKSGRIRAPVFRVRTTLSELTDRGAEILEAAPGSRSREGLIERWATSIFSRGEYASSIRSRVFHRTDGHFDADDSRILTGWLRHLEGFRILCLARGDADPSGALALNRAVLRELDDLFGPREGDYLPGEPVIVTRNDYELELFNGDTGAVFDVASDRGPATPMALFARPEGLRCYPPTQLELERAHALTVHKAQGSEYDRVLLILPGEDSWLLTRELLYTGLTRSRSSVVVAGEVAVLERGVRRRLARSSGLGQALEAKLRQRSSKGVG